MLDNYIYLIYYPHGVYHALSLTRAIEFSNSHDGFMIRKKTKDLFPTYYDVWEKDTENEDKILLLLVNKSAPE